MNEARPLQVVELRNYLMVAGKTHEFIRYFDKHFIDSQKEIGGFVLKEFTVAQSPDRFFWIRGFETMQERTRFLPAFYGGKTWKEFGPGANALMLEWHRVHLLKPAFNDQLIYPDTLSSFNGVFAIDYYTAKKGMLEELISLFNTRHHAFLKKNPVAHMSYWITEPSENDFPHLPVIPDEELLVTMSIYDSENAHLETIAAVQSDDNFTMLLSQLVAQKEQIILYPADAL